MSERVDELMDEMPNEITAWAAPGGFFWEPNTISYCYPDYGVRVRYVRASRIPSDTAKMQLLERLMREGVCELHLKTAFGVINVDPDKLVEALIHSTKESK